ncbi:Acetyltransferase (GNAT) family protein [Lentzea albidocapillata subsp. violacea]|uniref:Acetyltransferase (GNAT) family protein n=1 Tax=Lentzea albidocapillata subsp. violacea TaxID=128104 RepID=A0A1G9SQV6_9PSEU|nr:GNAT family N-acetyltransferase [Lentzea albidocapillata]SDM37245.1 Acetyltransferase (GNAT) family protein [Lentzea albidocapillata subsp. violacea]
MQIHQVMPDEWELWRDIRLDALASDPGEFGSTLAREQAYSEDDWRARAAEGLKLVALGPRPVALVAATAKPEGLYLYSMWVRDSHRGQGVGEALVRTVLTWAAEKGWKVVRLRVWDDNLPARRLYKRLGFVDAEEPEHMEFRVS